MRFLRLLLGFPSTVRIYSTGWRAAESVGRSVAARRAEEGLVSSTNGRSIFVRVFSFSFRTFDAFMSFCPVLTLCRNRQRCHVTR